MKRITLLLLTITLIIDLVAPTGAVFATEGLGSSIAEEVVVDVATVGDDVVTEAGAVDDIEETDVSVDPPVSMDIIQVTEAPLVVSSEDQAAEDEPPLQPSIAKDVVITEVQTRGVTGATSELVELFNGSDQPRDITGWCLRYASAAGESYSALACVRASDSEPSTRVILSAKSYLVLATSDRKTGSFVPDLIFSSTLTEAGGRLLLEDDKREMIDMVGWGTAVKSLGGAAPALSTATPLRSLQRTMIDTEYQDTRNNSADFTVREVKMIYQTGALSEATDVCLNILGIQLLVPEGAYRNKRGDCIDKATVNFCPGIKVSEIGANAVRQFIEVTNTSEVEVSLAGCRIMTNRSTAAAVILPEATLLPGAFYVVYLSDSVLKLTKTTTDTVYIIASDGETEVDGQYYEDLSSETSWAYFADGWRQTFAPTPELANIYEQYAPCSEGYLRNLATGRCNKVAEVSVPVDCGENRERNPATGRCRNTPTASQLTPCKEGQYRSEETNRCRSIATTVASVLKPCADDQFRNPETNRCKKIASVDELADCGEGRERNPETNRCRNVLSAAMPVAGFAPEVVTETATGMMGWWVAGGVSLAAVSYGVWQWRFEISRLTKKTAAYFTSRGK